MPLIDVCHDSSVPVDTVSDLTKSLTGVAAAALTCEEGKTLDQKDIMIKVDRVGLSDRNMKELCIRVWAHDYPSRRANIENIRRQISEEVVRYLKPGTSWYVWVFLVPTSYGSDTEV